MLEAAAVRVRLTAGVESTCLPPLLGEADVLWGVTASQGCRKVISRLKSVQ